jgi:hypothetical protein
LLLLPRCLQQCCFQALCDWHSQLLLLLLLLQGRELLVTAVQVCS